jgi:hypothetical protein
MQNIDWLLNFTKKLSEFVNWFFSPCLELGNQMPITYLLGSALVVGLGVGIIKVLIR